MSRMPKPADLDLANAFENLFAATNNSEHRGGLVDFLKETKLKSNTNTVSKLQGRALDDVVSFFKLTYGSRFRDPLLLSQWDIEMMPEVKEVKPSSYLSSTFLLFI
jgi:hypothetical protein